MVCFLHLERLIWFLDVYFWKQACQLWWFMINSHFGAIWVEFLCVNSRKDKRHLTCCHLQKESRGSFRLNRQMVQLPTELPVYQSWTSGRRTNVTSLAKTLTYMECLNKKAWRKFYIIHIYKGSNLDPGFSVLLFMVWVRPGIHRKLKKFRIGRQFLIHEWTDNLHRQAVHNRQNLEQYQDLDLERCLTSHRRIILEIFPSLNIQWNDSSSYLIPHLSFCDVVSF